VLLFCSRIRNTTRTSTDGDILVLYTDGLIERRREDIDAGPARLADVLGRYRDADPEFLADAVLRELLPREGRAPTPGSSSCDCEAAVRGGPRTRTPQGSYPLHRMVTNARANITITYRTYRASTFTRVTQIG
jgi:hypothetical protein